MQINTTQIQIALAERKMTWRQLADASGISRQNISTVIRRGTCTPRTAGKLAEGLSVPVARITAEKEESA